MTEDVRPIAHELAEIGRLTESEDVNGVLDRFIARAVRTIPGCAHVTITISGDGARTVETVAGMTEPDLVFTNGQQPVVAPVVD
ncbi:MAG: hypothetical protein ACRDQ1_03445, partial [Sciscionella sp.]